MSSADNQTGVYLINQVSVLRYLITVCMHGLQESPSAVEPAAVLSFRAI